MTMKLIQDFMNRQRAKAKEERIQDICTDFMVKEKDGRFWITHMGVAILEISPLDNAESISENLHNLRQTALKYENLND